MTQNPPDPVVIARKQQWGAQHQVQHCLRTLDENSGSQIDGAPAFYDKYIDVEFNNSVGVRKGQMR